MSVAVLPQKEPALDSRGKRERCVHCGLEAIRTRLWEGNTFCCAGCEGAYRLIHKLGFGKYYDIRGRDNAMPAGPVKVDTEGLEAFDAPEVMERFSVIEGDSRVVTLSIEGVHCAACIWLLERLPEMTSGIQSARLNFSEARLRVVLDPKSVKLSSVLSLISALGYRPKLLVADAPQREETGEHRAAMLRMGVAGFSAMNAMMMAVSLYEAHYTGIEEEFRRFLGWASLVVSIPAVLYSARPIVESALRALMHRRAHVDLPLSLAIIGGFIGSAVNVIRGSSEIYFDTVTALIFLLLVSRWFQRKSVSEIESASAFVPSLRSQVVYRLADGRADPVHLSKIRVEDRVRLSEAQVLPFDGRIESGSGAVDQSSVTGEPRVLDVAPGDRLFAGSRWVAGSAVVVVEATGEQTRIGRVVSTGIFRRAEHIALLDQVGRWFLWAVGVGVGIVALLHWGTPLFAAALLSLLIVSCPCAVAIGAPLAFARGLASAASEGYLIKGPSVLERMLRVGHVFFDKTGTLTSGDLRVKKISVWRDSKWNPLSRNEEILFAGIVRALEAHSRHPVGQSLYKWGYGVAPRNDRTSESSELLGGVSGEIDGDVWRIGSKRFVSGKRLSAGTEEIPNAALQSSEMGVFAVRGEGDEIFLITLEEEIEAGVESALDWLRSRKLSVSVLSGDRSVAVGEIGSRLGIPRQQIHGDLLPEDKVRVLEETLVPTLMVGDGVNDAPSLRTASVGVAVRGGAEVSLVAADVYMARGGAGEIPKLLRGAQRTMFRIKFGLWVSLLYNITAGVAAILGMITPLLAAVVMPLSSLTALYIVLAGKPYFKEE